MSHGNGQPHWVYVLEYQRCSRPKFDRVLWYPKPAGETEDSQNPHDVLYPLACKIKGRIVSSAGFLVMH